MLPAMKGSLENISMGMGIDLESLGPIANEVQYLGTTILIFICFRLLVVVITVVVLVLKIRQLVPIA